MKQIKKEDMKVGEFYYLKGKAYEWIIRIDELLIKGIGHIIKWWWIDIKRMKLNKSSSYFNYINGNGNAKMSNHAWKNFKFFMLNKKDEEDFKRNLLLQELK